MKIHKHPLAINILKYQAYNFEFFSCQEIILFETLVVLGGISFSKREEFFHSTKTLIEKSGIKRHTVDKTLNRFVDLGIIELQVKGMPRVKYISIVWDKVLELLPKIYQFDEFIKQFDGTTKPLYDFFNQLAENNKKFDENDKEKNIIKNNIEEYIDKEKYEEVVVVADARLQTTAKQLIDLLKEIFQERIDNYNLDNDKNKRSTPLPVKASVTEKMCQALKTKKDTEIKDAFIAFADDILYGGVKPRLDALSYFLKEDNGEYPVIDKYQLKFLEEFYISYEKN
jgi:hypothetical protein